jgi:hypothetical protein
MEIEIGDISSTKNCQEEREKDRKINSNRKWIQDIPVLTWDMGIPRDLSETRRDALNWLFPAPYDKRHIEISSQRKKNTGQWIFKTQEVQDWIKGNPSGRLLWGYGIRTYPYSILIQIIISHQLSN